jgi:putative membrane-bound dehydrogenase-like protein
MLVSSCERGPEPVRLADAGPRRIEVLFLGHASEHHNSAEYAPILAAALGAHGINIWYTEEPDDLNPDHLGLYDAVMLFANHDSITSGQERALLDFVASGHGFLPIHSASYCFRNSEAYVELVGAQFLEHGVGEFTAEMVDPDHPVMDGMQPFETWDETYVHHMHNPDRTVLHERVDDAGREPWTWVRNHGQGRVFYTAYGHDRRTWNQPMFHRLMRNAILWAVGDSAGNQLKQLALAPLGYTDSEAAVPNYERRPEALRLQEPLAPDESIAHWQVPPGFDIQLFASEPDIVNPIAMAWDERGRLWVLETIDYPNNMQPEGQGNDVLRIIEDLDGDGRADSFKIFADGLSIPTGLVFANGGVIVSQAPHFLFLQDTDGDDRADVREPIMSGWNTYDTHAGPSNLKYGLDNWYWGAVGYSGFQGTIGGDSMQFRQGIFRFRPDGSALERITDFTNNTWGLGFTESFDVFGSTANNEHSVFVAIPNRYYEGVNGVMGDGRKKIDGHYAIHPVTFNIRQVDSQGGFTSAAGHNFYTARSFPREYWNRVALVNEPTGNLLHRAVIEPDGSGFREADWWNMMASADEWASPIHADVGPDGAVWVLDWYNFIIQHNPTPPGFESGQGNAYETPLRDRHHGRIYRIAWRGADPYEPISLSVDRPDELVRTLTHDNMFWRTTAQRLLVERGNDDILDDLFEITSNRRVDDIGANAPAIHGIWTMHGLGALDGSNSEAERVVQRALIHPADGVRKNAIDALPRTEATSTALIQSGVLTDADQNVRLHALLAMSEVPPSNEVGAMLYEMGKDSALIRDEWLPTALFIAAARHRQGFLQGYSEDIGSVAFTDLAGRLARGELENTINLSAVDLDDSEWDSLPVPALWRETSLGPFEGVIWFRRVIELPALAAGRAATISLSRVNDTDDTYINGVRVGATEDAPDQPRQYDVSAGILRAGRNLVAVRLENRLGRGGMLGEADEMIIAGAGFRASLAGNWKYDIEVVWEGGRRPDIVAGVPFAQQFLQHYNPVGNLSMQAGVNAGASAGSARAVSLGAVEGENRYDQTLITVQAGERVSLTFNNTDDMPHNVVVLRAGSVDRVGALMNELATQPSGADQDYVPDTEDILVIMPMVAPRESGTVTFTAPPTPGDYPFVCSFPAHWLTMRGTLRVEE